MLVFLKDNPPSAAIFLRLWLKTCLVRVNAQARVRRKVCTGQRAALARHTPRSHLFDVCSVTATQEVNSSRQLAEYQRDFQEDWFAQRVPTVLCCIHDVKGTLLRKHVSCLRLLDHSLSRFIDNSCEIFRLIFSQEISIIEWISVVVFMT